MKIGNIFAYCYGKNIHDGSYNELTKDGINYKRKRDIKKALYPQSKKIRTI